MVRLVVLDRLAHAVRPGPTAYFGLHNVVMRHEIPDRPKVSEAFPHIVLHNLSTKIGERVGTILKHLFPVPKPDSRRVVSFVNQADFVSFRHLGALDQTEVENEGVLRAAVHEQREEEEGAVSTLQEKIRRNLVGSPTELCHSKSDRIDMNILTVKGRRSASPRAQHSTFTVKGHNQRPRLLFTFHSPALQSTLPSTITPLDW